MEPEARTAAAPAIDTKAMLLEIRAEEREMERLQKVRAETKRDVVSPEAAGLYEYVGEFPTFYNKIVRHTELSPPGVQKAPPGFRCWKGAVVVLSAGDLLPSSMGELRRLTDEEAESAVTVEDAARLKTEEASASNATDLKEATKSELARAEDLVEQKRAELAAAEEAAEKSAAIVSSAEAHEQRERKHFDALAAKHYTPERLALVRAALALAQRQPEAKPQAPVTKQNFPWHQFSNRAAAVEAFAKIKDELDLIQDAFLARVEAEGKLTGAGEKSNAIRQISEAYARGGVRAAEAKAIAITEHLGLSEHFEVR